MASAAVSNKKTTLIRKPTEKRAIDLVHLAKQTMGDQSLEREVLILFDQTARSYLSRLQEADSAEKLKLCLHTLKGAAAGVGANNIAEHTRQAEQQLRETGTVESEILDRVSVAVEEAHQLITELTAA